MFWGMKAVFGFIGVMLVSAFCGACGGTGCGEAKHDDSESKHGCCEIKHGCSDGEHCCDKAKHDGNDACGSVGICLTAVDDSTFRYCHDGSVRTLRLEKESDSLFRVCHLIGDSTADVWTLRHEVYRFDCGDMTGDGLPEIVVGVTKPTRYRPQNDRRLFIFHLYDGRLIRPLWLGSRLGGRLMDFVVERDSVPAMVHSWEADNDGCVTERIYRYEGFGLRFVGEATGNSIPSSSTDNDGCDLQRRPK